ncbi:MAG: hypothetical protein ACRDKL_11145 [Solirubrobacteraceae bacterium]
MTLAGVRAGDIVLIDRLGRRFHGVVIAKTQGQLEIEPIERNITYRTAKARDVVCVWRKSRPRSAREPAPEPAGAP